jgi:hypothetical protein
MQRYRADRAFDSFNAGQEVELDPNDEQHARWINTGYLEPLEDAEPDEEPAAPDGGQSQTTTPADSVAVSGTPNEVDQGEPAPAARKARRRAASEPADAGASQGQTGETGE